MDNLHLSFEAAQYFLKKLSLDEVVDVRFLWKKVNEAPQRIQRYIKMICSNAEQFENFLNIYPDLFIVENERVAHGDSAFGNGGIKAVEYFEDILQDYYEDYNPHYMNLKGHIGQAPENARSFMNNLYRGRFKDFLESHRDVFNVFPDGTVSLIEDDSVEYFKDILEDYGDGQNYMSLRGHIGQAPRHVQEFINEYYPGREFIDFLRNNDDVFELSNKTVYLQ